MYRLLIIDDEKKILEGICGLFPWEEIGFRVEATFTSAVKALKYIEEHGTDVVLTDIEMPDMTGLELCSRLSGYEAIQGRRTPDYNFQIPSKRGNRGCSGSGRQIRRMRGWTGKERTDWL